MTLAFSYIRDHLLEEIDELLQELEVWCQSREKEAGKDQEEIIVNDWAMPMLLQGKPHLKPVLGVLLNKRRKDVRLPYKHGIGNHVDSLAENNLNCGFYQDYLKNTFDIQRFEFESCGYKVTIPDGHHSLHLPFSRQIPRSIARFMPFADMVTGENKSCRKTAQDIVTKSISVSEASENGGKI